MAYIKKCKVCQEGITVRPCRLGRAKYCSKLCQNKAMIGRRISPATEFKPGERPLTWVPVGTESMSKGYVRVKVADPDVWRQRSHVTWEEANGKPLPAGWIVRHSDGDPVNDAPGNLVAMSRGNHLSKTLEVPEVRARKISRARKAVKKRWKDFREKKLEQYDTYYWETA